MDVDIIDWSKMQSEFDTITPNIFDSWEFPVLVINMEIFEFDSWFHQIENNRLLFKVYSTNGSDSTANDSLAFSTNLNLCWFSIENWEIFYDFGKSCFILVQKYWYL